MVKQSGNEFREWPTTLRFSRRMGESIRDANYATALEGPRPHRSWLRDLLILGSRMNWRPTTGSPKVASREP